VEKKIELIFDRVRLESLVLKTVTAKPGAESFAFQEDSRLEVKREKGDEVILRLIEQYCFEPLGHLEMEIVVVGQVKVDPEFTEGEIAAAVEASGYPLYSTRSLLVGYLTNMALGFPIVLPPFPTEDGLAEPGDQSEKIQSNVDI
jgi:hypothetical protein